MLRLLDNILDIIFGANVMLFINSLKHGDLLWLRHVFDSPKNLALNMKFGARFLFTTNFFG
jgi:hypothetical protein